MKKFFVRAIVLSILTAAALSTVLFAQNENNTIAVVERLTNICQQSHTHP